VIPEDCLMVVEKSSCIYIDIIYSRKLQTHKTACLR
jgi:hypothetical protein